MSANWFSVNSLLFTPALKADRFDRALQVKADCLIIDLEDSISLDKKTQARSLASQYLQQNFQDNLLRGVRINSLKTADGLQDILALQAAQQLDAIFLPKTETVAEVKEVIELFAKKFPKLVLIPMIETARGLNNIFAISEVNQIAGIMFGGADFAADLGATMTWENLFIARMTLVQAAACSQKIATYDMPFLNFTDNAGLEKETTAIKNMGFTGKAAIHPQQIAIINKTFIPTKQEIMQAEKIVAAAKASHGDVVALEGKMIDAPVVRSAQRILDISKRKN